MSTNWQLETDWFIVCLLNMYLSVNTKKIIDDKNLVIILLLTYIYELSLSEKDKKKHALLSHSKSPWPEKQNFVQKL